jgi:hypothetical protein
MGRKCTVCAHKDKAEIDRRIVANEGSALAIARCFDLSKDSVLRHRRHLDSAIRNAQLVKSTGFQELTTAVERLTAKMQRHLTNSQRSDVWFKESGELRQWIALRAKLAGKLVPDDAGAPRKSGDSYCVQFIGPGGKPVSIPLAVYRALPAFKNGAEGAETGHQLDTSTVSDSVHAGLGGKLD